MQFARQEYPGGPYVEKLVTSLVYYRFYDPEFELVPGTPRWVTSAVGTGRSYKLSGLVEESTWALMKVKDPRIKAMLDPQDFSISIYEQQYGPVWKLQKDATWGGFSDGLWSDFLKVGFNGIVMGVGPAPQTEEELLRAYNGLEFQKARQRRHQTGTIWR
jgi:hypothetical protein